MFVKHVSTFNNLNTLYDHENTNQGLKLLYTSNYNM